MKIVYLLALGILLTTAAFAQDAGFYLEFAYRKWLNLVFFRKFPYSKIMFVQTFKVPMAYYFIS